MNRGRGQHIGDLSARWALQRGVHSRSLRPSLPRRWHWTQRAFVRLVQGTEPGSCAFRRAGRVKARGLPAAW